MMFWLVDVALELKMAAVVDIVSRCLFRIKKHHRNQPNKSKLALYKPLFLFWESFKSVVTSWYSYI